MSANHRLGAWAENAALEFLQLCGYRCVGRRFRRPGGEIDLVCRRGQLLVFVEVKARGPGSPAPAVSWVHPLQLRRLRRLARIWMHENGGCPAAGCRFDLVAIDYLGEEEGLTLRHVAGIG